MLAVAHAQDDTPTWTTVFVDAPPSECCQSAWTSDEVCNTIQTAVDAAAEYTEIRVRAGDYCTQNWFQNTDTPTSLSNPALVTISDRTNLKLVGDDFDNKPKLCVDGSAGIQISSSTGITVQYLEVVGPARNITGEDASANRQRITGRNPDTGCGLNDETVCDTVDGCQWNSSLSYCLGDVYPYYSGMCLKAETSSDLLIDGNELHHCTSSGIYCSQVDDATISNNSIYGNTWWTHSATSGVVIANSQGSGTNMLSGNAVYANRNFLPIFMLQETNAGADVDYYGQWNNTAVKDGQGVSLTNNADYEGIFVLTNNVAYDNGINGVVIHKSTHDNVTTYARNNRIFDNGSTTVDIEGRQVAGGFTVNSGSSRTTSHQQILGNAVTVADTDVSFQCFGTCSADSGSGGNAACGGAPSTKFDSSIFVTDPFCTAQAALNDVVRGQYAEACMPVCPQYTDFVNNANNTCVEPQPANACLPESERSSCVDSLFGDHDGFKESSFSVQGVSMLTLAASALATASLL